MKIDKKVIESAAVAVFALAIIISAVVGGNVDTNAEQYTRGDMAEVTEVQAATKEKTEVGVVAVADETTVPEVAGAEEEVAVAEELVAEELVAEEPVAEEPVVEEESEWATKLMPDVKEYLNIRAEADAESELLGKLHKGAVADILERGEEWSKISSGSVEGYVKNEFCVFDEEAEAMAREQGIMYATALKGGLRVRKEPVVSGDEGILYVMEEGEKIKVDTETEAPEGWVAVLCSDKTAYVSEEYVSVELELGKAISIEEEREAIRREQEEARKKAQVASSGRTQKAAIAASYDELTLLAGLIQCEAGGECYEGQVAVGAVVMNRLRCGFAGSIVDVIYQSGQFTPAYSGTLANVLASGSISGSCYQAAQEALNGVDNVSGCLYFKRASSGQPGIVIGNHVFY